MPRWIPDADFYRNREADRIEAATRPTRPALICSQCKEELPAVWSPFMDEADKYTLAEENGVFVRHHKKCGGRVDWAEVVFARKVKRG